MSSLLLISYQLLALCVAVYGVTTNNVSPQLLAAGGNRTTLKSQIAPGLTSSADYRGTLDIVWSCVLTLTACIYTALHLNIPSNLGRKITWAAIALIAPEIVLYTALQQFTEARDLVKQLNELRFGKKYSQRDQEPSGTSESKPFDLRYGYYVTMGGFTVDVDKLHNELSRVTLTPRGVIALAERGHFLDISPETVSDKSKANIIKKVLICTQVLWMVVQCIARKVADYPLTLLEIHTMVHVFCALTLYILWWMKPLDINDPTLFDLSNDAEFFELIAVLLISSRKASISGLRTGQPEVTELKLRNQSRRESSDERAVNSGTESDLNAIPTLSWRDDYNHGRTAPSEKDIQRWKLAYQGISKDKSMPEDFLARDWVQNLVPLSSALTIHSPTDYYGMETNVEFHESFDSDKRASLALVLLPVVYGGIHLAAWGFEFPSPAESLLWKIACLVVMSAFFLFLPIYYLFAWITDLMSSPTVPPLMESLAERVMSLFANMFLIIFAAARIFIVLESFLSLRHVPIGVYATVPWVQNIPHI